MTVTIGMVRRDCVLLAADSAVTHTESPRTARSTLGEPTLRMGMKVVEERAAKIVQLGPFAAATITGDEGGATEFLRWLRPHVGRDDAADILRSTHATLRPREAFEIGLARYHRGAPELFWYRSKAGVVVRSPSVVTGSLPQNAKAEIEALARNFGAHGWPPEAGAVGLVSCLMRTGLHERSKFFHGVGGAYHAAIVGPSGVSWISDTKLLTIPRRTPAEKMWPNPKSVDGEIPMGGDWISVVERGGIVAIGSSILGQARVLTNDFVRSDLAAWYDRWGQDVLNAIRHGSPRFVVLISKEIERIIVVDLQAGGDEFVQMMGDRHAFRDDLISAFFAPLTGGRREIRLLPETELTSTSKLLSASSISRGDARDLADHSLAAHEEGRADEAETCLLRALAAAPDDEWVVACAAFLVGTEAGHSTLERALTTAMNEGGVSSQLVTHLVLACSDHDESRAEAALRFLSTVRPDDPDILGDLAARVASRSGAPEDADALWTSAHKVAPEHGNNLANHGIFIAESLKDLDRARTLIERIPPSHPKGVSALLHLGGLFWRAERRPEALELWEEGLKRAPDAPDVVEQVGCALWILGLDSTRAETLLRRAASLDTRAIAYQVNLLRFHLCSRHPGARHRLRQMLRRPDLPGEVALELRFCEAAHVGRTPGGMKVIQDLLQKGVHLQDCELRLHLAACGEDVEFFERLADAIEGRRAPTFLYQQPPASEDLPGIAGTEGSLDLARNSRSSID